KNQHVRLSGCVDDPWSPNALDGIEIDDPVVIVGTGLTALDVLVSLERKGHRGRVLFVSRGGRFPLRHGAANSARPPASIDPQALGSSARQALRTLRQIARARVAAGLGWQEVIDAVRPHTAAVWAMWSSADRSRFLRRLRPFWDIHRHRAPQHVVALADAGLESGRITMARGTIERVKNPEHAAGPRLSVAIRTVSGRLFVYRAQWIVNCIGPAMRITEATDPLIRSLLAEGTAITDCESLGLLADAHARLLRGDGTADERLYLIGALRRGEMWESTAVPELR